MSLLPDLGRHPDLRVDAPRIACLDLCHSGTEGAELSRFAGLESGLRNLHGDTPDFLEHGRFVPQGPEIAHVVDVAGRTAPLHTGIDVSVRIERDGRAAGTAVRLHLGVIPR